MPRRLKLRPHLSEGEIGRRSRLSPDVVTRDPWPVLWQFQWDGRVERVAWRVGYSAKWVGPLVRRYNAAGPEAVGDQRKRNRGAKPLLNADQCARLAQGLEGPAPHGDLWTGPPVARWMSAVLGRPVYPQRGWEYLRRCGDTPPPPAAAPRGRRGRRPGGCSHTLAARVTARQQAQPHAPLEPGGGGRPSRGPQAHPAADLGPPWPAAPRSRSPPLPVGIRLRLCAARNRRHALAPDAQREHRGFQ